MGEELLHVLHERHFRSVPFEDLDIHQNIPIQLDLAHLYQKIVLRRRGGFCYELNYLFAQLLRGLGFECQLVAARIFAEKDAWGPEFDHLALLVTLDEPWLVDVGYGDLFFFPKTISDQKIQGDRDKYYRIDRVEGDGFVLHESRDGNDFSKRYRFDLRPRRIEDFYAECTRKQESVDSYFVKNKICTLPTVRGRMTLFNDKFIETVDGVKTQSMIASTADLEILLATKFDILLNP